MTGQGGISTKIQTDLNKISNSIKGNKMDKFGKLLLATVLIPAAVDAAQKACALYAAELLKDVEQPQGTQATTEPVDTAEKAE